MSGDDLWWQAALPELGPSQPGLAVRLAAQHVPAAMLTLPGKTLSGLSTLLLCAPEAQYVVPGPVQWRLPHPSTLPALRHLTVRCRDDSDLNAAFWHSVGDYAPQLQTLAIDAGITFDSWDWGRVFRADTASITLHSVCLSGMLDTFGVAALRHAAGIRTLSVQSLATMAMMSEDGDDETQASVHMMLSICCASGICASDLCLSLIVRTQYSYPAHLSCHTRERHVFRPCYL